MYRFIVKGAAIALALMAGTAAAQQEPRTNVDWLLEPGNEDGLTTILPFPDSPDLPPIEATVPVDSGIVEDIQSFDEVLIGIDELPEPVASKLGAEFWDGTDSAQRSTALASAGLSDIHAANRLLITILLTPGQREDPALDRARALLEIGAVPEAVRVAGSIQPATPESLAVFTLGSILLGKGANACESMRTAHGEMLPSGAEGIYCAVIRGQHSLADVRFSLMRDMRQIDDLEAGLLYGLIVDDPHYAQIPEEQVPLSDFAAGLLVQSGRELPSWWSPETRAAQLWLRTTDFVKPDYRLEAVKALEARGLMSTERLAQEYADLDAHLTGDDAALARVLSESEWLRDHPRFPEVLEKLLRKARDNGTEGQTARMIAPVAREIEPHPDRAKHARTMQRIFLIASDPDAASLWIPDPPTRRESRLMALANGQREATNVSIADSSVADITDSPQPDRSLEAALAALSNEPRRVNAVEALKVISTLRAEGLSPEQIVALLQGLHSDELNSAVRQIAIEVVLLGV